MNLSGIRNAIMGMSEKPFSSFEVEIGAQGAWAGLERDLEKSPAAVMEEDSGAKFNLPIVIQSKF